MRPDSTLDTLWTQQKGGPEGVDVCRYCLAHTVWQRNDTVGGGGLEGTDRHALATHPDELLFHAPPALEELDPAERERE